MIPAHTQYHTTDLSVEAQADFIAHTVLHTDLSIEAKADPIAHTILHHGSVDRGSG